MNTELRKNVKNEFEKDFFMFMNNAAFGKTMENVRKYRDTNLVANEARRNYLVSEPKNHTFFFKKLISHRNKKNTPQIFINKPVILVLTISEMSEIIVHEFW